MDDYKFAEFGARLRDIREQKGFKQGRFADMVGVSRQSMSNYESGKFSPDIEAVKNMAKVLSCSTDYLLGLTEYPSFEDHTWNNEKIASISESLALVPPDVRKVWLNQFYRIAKCVRQGIDRGVDAGFEAKPFYELTKIWELCFSAVDKQKAGEYTEKAMWTAQDNLRRMMQYLRNDWNELEDICFELVAPRPDDDCGSDNTNNTITHKNEG